MCVVTKGITYYFVVTKGITYYFVNIDCMLFAVVAFFLKAEIEGGKKWTGVVTKEDK